MQEVPSTSCFILQQSRFVLSMHIVEVAEQLKTKSIDFQRFEIENREGMSRYVSFETRRFRRKDWDVYIKMHKGDRDYTESL